MYDLITLKPIDGTYQGMVRDGVVYPMPGTPSNPAVAVVRFQEIRPSTFARWLSGDIHAVDSGWTSLRLRLSNGQTDYYFDDNLNLVEVVDSTAWDHEYSRVHDLAQLDVWTHQSLVVVLASVDSGRGAPAIGAVEILLECVAEEDAVAQAILQIAACIGRIRLPLFMSFVAGSDGSQFSVETTRGYTPLSAVATVDGEYRVVAVDASNLTILGPLVRAGQLVKLEVSCSVPVTVRRDVGSSTPMQVPVWVLRDLVKIDGTTNGRLPPRFVGSYAVTRFRADLRITIRGIAGKQNDALAMRASLQEAMSSITVGLSSGRSISVTDDGVVEMISGSGSLPEAVGNLIAVVQHVGSVTKMASSRNEDGSRSQTSINSQFNA